MERSVLEMLSDRSSTPTLLGCRPSAQKSLGCSQKRFQLLTKSSFCSLHHDNNHSFKANSLLNLSCPRRYVIKRHFTRFRIAWAWLFRSICSVLMLQPLFSLDIKGFVTNTLLKYIPNKKKIQYYQTIRCSWTPTKVLVFHFHFHLYKREQARKIF